MSFSSHIHLISSSHADASAASKCRHTSALPEKTYFSSFLTLHTFFSLLGWLKNCQAADKIEARIIYILLAFCKYYETSHFALITYFSGWCGCVCASAGWRWQSNIIWLEWEREQRRGGEISSAQKILPNLNLQFRLHIISVRVEGKFETKSHLFGWKWNKVNLSHLFNSSFSLLPAWTYHIVLLCVLYMCTELSG